MNNLKIIREIAEYVQKRLEHIQNSLIAVTGPGCAGKTEFCGEMIKCIPDSRIFSLDGYYYDIKLRRRKGLTGAHADSIYINTLMHDLKKMKRGASFKKLVSNINNEYDNKRYHPAKYNLIDGLSALLIPKITLYDLIIFIDCDFDVQVKRRIPRDCGTRGRPRDEIISIAKTREEQFKKFVLPKRKYSNIILKSLEGYEIVYSDDKKV